MTWGTDIFSTHPKTFQRSGGKRRQRPRANRGPSCQTLWRRQHCFWTPSSSDDRNPSHRKRDNQETASLATLWSTLRPELSTVFRKSKCCRPWTPHQHWWGISQTRSKFHCTIYWLLWWLWDVLRLAWLSMRAHHSLLGWGQRRILSHCRMSSR